MRSLPAVDLVARLISLVRSGDIQAVDETSPASNNRFVFTHEGIEFSTEWLQDDKPTLFIDGEEAICDYAVKPLITELRTRFAQPPTPIKAYEEHQRQRAAKQKHLVDETLKRLKKKK